MNEWPASEMTAFPITWYTIDEDKGWIIAEVMNRMSDLGDGNIYQEPNITILHYAGNGLFKYEEDAYNPHNMGVTIGAWIKAKKRLELNNAFTDFRNELVLQQRSNIVLRFDMRSSPLCKRRFCRSLSGSARNGNVG